MRKMLLSLTLLILCACGAQPSIDQQTSGFLPQSIYPKMQVIDESSGQQGRRWVAPDFDREAYHAVFIEPMKLHAPSRLAQHTSLAALKEIEQLGTDKLRQSLGAKVPIASAPGPGVLTINSAITGVAVGDAALKFYQYIPFSLAIQGMKSAAGLRKQEVYIVLEAKLSDGKDQRLVAAMIRAFEGKHLSSAREALSSVHIEDELSSVLEQASQRIASVILSTENPAP